ncbi:MAG: hypothetical protein AAB091_07130, partial [Elusimicrobiota bacterium]
DFITPQQYPLESQTRVFGPADACDFLVPCPGRCAGEGSFDLTDKIRLAIEARRQNGEEKGVCGESIALGSPDACGLQMRCTIETAYL